MSMTNPLVSPDANIVQNNQLIYVLAENTGSPTNPATGCTTIVELPLSVIPSPVVPLDIEDYVICDTDNDGFSPFDFDTEITPQIFAGGQTPADFTLSYHTTPGEANTGKKPIVNTINYTNVNNQQTIYISLVSNTNG